jgi:hypothetical protein
MQSRDIIDTAAAALAAHILAYHGARKYRRTVRHLTLTDVEVYVLKKWFKDREVAMNLKIWGSVDLDRDRPIMGYCTVSSRRDEKPDPFYRTHISGDGGRIFNCNFHSDPEDLKAVGFHVDLRDDPENPGRPIFVSTSRNVTHDNDQGLLWQEISYGDTEADQQDNQGK